VSRNTSLGPGSGHTRIAPHTAHWPVPSPESGGSPRHSGHADASVRSPRSGLTVQGTESFYEPHGLAPTTSVTASGTYACLMPEQDLAAALVTFDRVELNLSRLEAVWQELRDMVPEGTVWSIDNARYAELSRSFADLAEGLPAIGGYRITSRPLPADEIFENQVDARESRRNLRPT
jgi:hypothetical protein